MEILGIAAQGMDQAQGQFEKTARRIAQTGAGAAGGDSVSLSDEMVSLLQSRNDFEANVASAHVADDMLKATLSLLA